MATELALEHDYDLLSKYRAVGEAVFLSGTQAMVRLILDQLARDAAGSLRTEAFVSGYPGSPLGGLDLELARNSALVRERGVTHVPGHNEELAATAVWGSQAAMTFPDATHDGVVGVWYGKGPGLDRASDAIRHAQYIGTSRNGGVVAFVGDDPACKSSSIPNSSEQTLRDLGVPTLVPGHVGEILELGPHAVAMSRLSGLWTGVRIVTSVADGTRSIVVGGAPAIVVPELEWRGRPFVPTLSAIPCPPWSIDVEEEVSGPRVEMARAYGYLNGLNPVTASTPDAWLGLVAVGHQHAELVTALGKLGLTLEQAAALGIRVLNVRQPYPLDPRTIREFAHGLSEIFVIEEKRAFVESAVREALYGTAQQPVVVGRADERGAALLPMRGALDADTLLPRLRSRMEQRIDAQRLRPPRPERALLPVIGAARAPYFCSGCPHNTSTRVPDDALVGGGIGCHSMAQFMEPEITGKTSSMTHMGAEGSQWIGIAPYVESDHMFQNIGDGTYFHSGQLAVQAAIAAGSHITYKILYNDAIAMTGGQQPSESNALPVPALVEVLLRQGVRRVLITTDDRSRYRRVRLPRGVEVWDRSRMIEAQETLRTVDGVTVLIHDQRCAAENRRDRKRKKIPTPSERIYINERVCEGCGDCGAKSNCLSVEPVETEYGRKTQINQDSCNLDFSCLHGDCPSFVKVRLPAKARARQERRARRRDDRVAALLASQLDDVVLPEVGADGYTVRMPGIGGTGVVTASQILGTAALLDGLVSSGLDQTGLSQKAGPVISDLTMTRGEASGANKAGAESADLVLGFDVLVTGAEATMASMSPGRTRAVVSTARTPTGAMVSDVRREWPDEEGFRQQLEERLGPDRVVWVDVERITAGLLGSAAGGNIFLIGVAYQRGGLPMAAAAIERAISLNGVAVQANVDAFRLGRLWVSRRREVERLLPAERVRSTPTRRRHDLAGVEVVEGSRELVSVRAGELVDYQDAAYAARYLRTIESVSRAEAALRPGSHAFTDAAAASLFKLMAYKDEYEVARLSLDPAVAEDIRARFGDDVSFAWQLHPPVLRDRGLDRKLSLGRWFTPAYLTLARMRRLRGTRLDPFGRTETRRLERDLIAEFESVLADIAARLSAERFDVAVHIAGLPDLVRGYESVKATSAETYRTELARAISDYDQKGEAA
ncbi:indolepyruvate ferredoxin oxidoreductase family protein [Nocardioides hungaricus]